MTVVNYNIIFSIFMLMLGIVLVYASWSVDSSTLQCTNEKLKNANKLILCIGVAMVTLSVSYLQRDVECQMYELNPTFYFVLSFLLGVVITVLGVIISVDGGNNCRTVNSNLVWIIGVIIMISSVTLMYKDGVFSKFF